MLNVVTFKWKPYPGYRSQFGPEAVNTLAAMVARHYSGEHRVLCITDDPAGIDSSIDTMALWDDLADVPNPSGPNRNPSCYRRLKLFAPEMRDLIGERIVCLDLDVVITGNLDPLWDRADDFICWGDTRRDNHYNGSMFLLRAGTRTAVWKGFDPLTSPATARAAGYFGSDQGWLSYKLGPGEHRWTKRDGVYSFRNHIDRDGGRLPRDARIVFFHGHVDPWDKDAQRLGWVKEHYTREGS